MKFYQCFLISLLYYIILQCSISKAQQTPTNNAVVYEGPAVVSVSDEFSLTCFTSLFPIFKWHRNGGVVEHANSKYGNNETSAFSTLTIKSVSADVDAGNYKCTSESDDYGHNVTVISGTIPKLRFEFPQGKSTCLTPAKQENCVLGTLFSKLTVKCIYDGSLNSSWTLDWYHSTDGDGVAVKDRNYALVKGTSGGQLDIGLLSAADLGFYQCKVTLKESPNSAPLAIEHFEIQAFPLVTPIVKDITVVEGSTINVTCAVTGKATAVVWKFGDKMMINGTENRVTLKDFRGIPGATLLIQHANSTTDRGHYNCSAVSPYGNSSSFGLSNVRIKSKYAALAPFLGICAEVIILCTIILIYEKKRDKTELEESDTDQGPETKSSPDHGQDSVRYRK